MIWGEPREDCLGGHVWPRGAGLCLGMGSLLGAAGNRLEAKKWEISEFWRKLQLIHPVELGALSPSHDSEMLFKGGI